MKIIGEGLAIFLTIINVIGTIAITVLFFWIDKDEGIVIIFINLIPQIFCIVLLIDFCVDECSKMCENPKCDGSNCNCQGGDLGGLICALILFIVIFVFLVIIFAFFYIFTKLMGKHISRFCSLGVIIFFELGISLYSLYLFFDKDQKFIFICGTSFCLALIDLFGILYSSHYGPSYEESDSQGQIYNTGFETFKPKNDLTEKIEIKNGFEPTSAENNLEEKKNNPPMDNITTSNNDYNDEIKRVESNYSNAPLPIDLPKENEIYKQN